MEGQVAGAGARLAVRQSLSVHAARSDAAITTVVAATAVANKSHSSGGTPLTGIDGMKVTTMALPTTPTIRR